VKGRVSRTGSAAGRAVRAVTFDVGNTLFPFRRREMDRLLGRFLEFIEDRFGPCDREAVVRRYNEVRQEQYRVNLPWLRENDLVERVRLTLEAVVDEVDPELLSDAVLAYVEALARTLSPAPGTRRLLEALREVYPLGVITNYPYAPGTRHVLKAHGLEDVFSAVVISAEWEFIKPHPLLFRQAAAQLGVPVENLLHVGDDWEADIIGATRAGASSVYFTGLREEPDPRRGDPEGRPLAEVDDLEELLDVLSVAPAGGRSRVQPTWPPAGCR